MKKKLQLLAGVFAMALAGSASAALDLPNTNNGSLWLTVWDTSAGATKSYARDLGLNLNDFLPNSITTAAGDGGVTGTRTPEAGVSNLLFAGDPLFASTFAGISSSNLAWNVYAADRSTGGSVGFSRVAVTGAVGTPITNALNNNSVDNAGTRGITVATQLNNAWGCNISASCAVTDPGDVAFGGGSNWGDSLGLALSSFAGTSTTIGNALEFFYFVRSVASAGGTSQSQKTVFENSTGRATWTMASNGDLVYNLAGTPSAVPVPAAVWLLGSGLFGLVGVARRRKQPLAA
ncbi:MAG: VPLPA-CTERM sorting domain-containing protein [Burkholderiales bacterium]